MSTTAGSGQDLSARDVKRLLTRGGFKRRGLTFTENTVTLAHDGGRQITEVEIRGPEELRSEAFLVLLDAGLSCAPYPERDLWQRP